MLAGSQSPYDSIYGCYLAKQRSIRTDQYKLIAYPEAKTLRLYDIEHDPLEENDLAQNPGMKPILDDLFRRLIALQTKMNDDLDLSALTPQ
jgi:choline-sulfatase